MGWVGNVLETASGVFPNGLPGDPLRSGRGYMYCDSCTFVSFAMPVGIV